MKVFAYFAIVCGVFQFASIGYDEYRGVTGSPSDMPDVLHKQSEPENFHNAIMIHCLYASGFLFLGILMLDFEKGADKSDPMSPDFAGNKALDDWGKDMEEADERRRVHKKD